MITFNDYKDCLFKGRNLYKSQLLFRSDKHEIKTLEVNKLALSSQDDKRVTIDGIASYAMGYYKIKKMAYKVNVLTYRLGRASNSEPDSEEERIAE